MDKVTTQIKTDAYFKKHAEHVRARQMQEYAKYWEETSSQTVPKLKDQTVANSFIDQIMKYREAVMEHGPFTRVNDPLLFATEEMNEIQKGLVYVKKKYSTHRDPDLESVIPALEKMKLKDPITKIVERNNGSEQDVQRCIDKYCCVTHASTVEFMA